MIYVTSDLHGYPLEKIKDMLNKVGFSNDDFLWNRPKHDDRYFDDVITVFGHTPTIYYGEEYKGKAVVTDTWIDVDAGTSCGFLPMLLRLDDLKEFYF